MPSPGAGSASTTSAVEAEASLTAQAVVPAAKSPEVDRSIARLPAATSYSVALAAVVQLNRSPGASRATVNDVPPTRPHATQPGKRNEPTRVAQAPLLNAA